MEETPSLSPREQGDLLPQEAHRQVRFFIVYYTVLLVLSLLALGFLWQNALVVQQWAAPQWLQTLILPLFTTMLGGMMGNVLYSIRVMYNHYIKKRDYDPKWWGKYFSGPFEAAVLALVVYALPGAGRDGDAQRPGAGGLGGLQHPGCGGMVAGPQQNPLPPRRTVVDLRADAFPLGGAGGGSHLRFGDGPRPGSRCRIPISQACPCFSLYVKGMWMGPPIPSP